MTLTSSDLFVEDELPGWGGSTQSLNTAWLDSLRARPDAEHRDLDIAVALMDLVHDDLMRSGTRGGEQLSNGELRTAIRTLKVITERLEVPFTLPFYDHSGWKTWWVRNGAHGSWQARRELLSDLFDDATAALIAAQDHSPGSSLADPVTSHERLGWPSVDTEVGELRRHFRGARTPQDYRGIGNDCAHLLEALSAQVYDHSKHTPPGESEPPVQQTKLRLHAYISDRLQGPDNAPLRRLAKSAIEAAQLVKHSREPSRTIAGIAADSVILLANMLRRLEDEPNDS